MGITKFTFLAISVVLFLTSHSQSKAVPQVPVSNDNIEETLPNGLIQENQRLFDTQDVKGPTGVEMIKKKDSRALFPALEEEVRQFGQQGLFNGQQNLNQQGLLGNPNLQGQQGLFNGQQNLNLQGQQGLFNGQSNLNFQSQQGLLGGQSNFDPQGQQGLFANQPNLNFQQQAFLSANQPGLNFQGGSAMMNQHLNPANQGFLNSPYGQQSLMNSQSSLTQALLAQQGLYNPLLGGRPGLFNNRKLFFQAGLGGLLFNRPDGIINHAHLQTPGLVNNLHNVNVANTSPFLNPGLINNPLVPGLMNNQGLNQGLFSNQLNQGLLGGQNSQLALQQQQLGLNSFQNAGLQNPALLNNQAGLGFPNQQGLLNNGNFQNQGLQNQQLGLQNNGFGNNGLGNNGFGANGLGNTGLGNNGFGNNGLGNNGLINNGLGNNGLVNNGLGNNGFGNNGLSSNGFGNNGLGNNGLGNNGLGNNGFGNNGLGNNGFGNTGLGNSLNRLPYGNGLSKNLPLSLDGRTDPSEIFFSADPIFESEKSYRQSESRQPKDKEEKVGEALEEDKHKNEVV